MMHTSARSGRSSLAWTWGWPEVTPSIPAIRCLATALVACVATVLAGDTGRASSARQSAPRSLPDASTVLRVVGDYLDGYETAVAGVVADEAYEQRFTPALEARQFSADRIRLRSDLVVFGDPAYGLLAFRDVLEVDGRALRNRNQRLTRLFQQPSASARAQALADQAEGARSNIDVPGVSTDRTLNVPFAALLYFRRSFQAHSTFTVKGDGRVGGRAAVVVAFREQALPRLIASADNVAMAGTAWVEPTSGRVLRTALDYTLTKDAYATRAQISR